MLTYFQQPLFPLLIVVCTLLGSSAAQINSVPTPQLGQSVDITWGVKIPMSDGVKLNATLYRPHAQAEPRPVIVTLTPYIADDYHARGMFSRTTDTFLHPWTAAAAAIPKATLCFREYCNGWQVASQ